MFGILKKAPQESEVPFSVSNDGEKFAIKYSGDGLVKQRVAVCDDKQVAQWFAGLANEQEEVMLKQQAKAKDATTAFPF